MSSLRGSGAGHDEDGAVGLRFDGDERARRQELERFLGQVDGAVPAHDGEVLAAPALSPDPPVADGDGAVEVPADLGVVGDQNDGRTGPAYRVEGEQDLVPGAGVELAGGLV